MCVVLVCCEGLAGIGDLMLTAFGDLSRNRSCGKRMAQGETVGDITAAMTVEGVYSAKVNSTIHSEDDNMLRDDVIVVMMMVCGDDIGCVSIKCKVLVAVALYIW
jgi:glycerol-3-phosphate dehydrogenase